MDSRSGQISEIARMNLHKKEIVVWKSNGRIWQKMEALGTEMERILK